MFSSMKIASISAWWERFRDRPLLGGPGIDVSKHQGKIDWIAAYNELDADSDDDQSPWVYVKATEGQDYEDPRSLDNITGAAEAGFDVGAYHFARLDSGKDAADDARAEMDDFLGTIHGLPLSLRPCIDVELGGIKRRDSLWCAFWCNAAVERVRERTGVLPVIYTGYWSMRWIFRGTAPTIADCPLWQAEYTNGKRPRRKIDGWEPMLWQHTSKGRVLGIPGNVDRNVVLCSPEMFDTLRVASNEVA